MVDMLKGSLEFGTAKTAKAYGFNRIGGAKTGTTQKWSDAWFIGFTPHVVAGVWVGYGNYELTLGRRIPEQ